MLIMSFSFISLRHRKMTESIKPLSFQKTIINYLLLLWKNYLKSMKS
jgi:hypothetical protein